jgi:hypothetical protein
MSGKPKRKSSGIWLIKIVDFVTVVWEYSRVLAYATQVKSPLMLKNKKFPGGRTRSSLMEEQEVS